MYSNTVTSGDLMVPFRFMTETFDLLLGFGDTVFEDLMWLCCDIHSGV